MAGVAGLLLVGACTAASTPTEDVSTSGATTPPTTTTVSVVLDFASGRPTLFDAGMKYRQELLIVPIEVQFGVDGWRSDVSTEQLVAFLNSGTGTSIAAAITIWSNEVTPAQLMRSVTAVAESVDGPRPLTVGGIEGEVVDVLIAAKEVDPNNTRDHACNDAWDFKARGELGEISQYERKQLGTVAGCGWSRLWFGPIGENLAVVGITRFDASPSDPGELSDLAPYDEDFLRAITFCVGTRCS